jgi:hypothetical protein
MSPRLIGTSLICVVASPASANRPPNIADDYRADIDRLLDHRFWLTLPVASRDLKRPTIR